MHLIVCSSRDVASMNIMNNLLTMLDFERGKIGDYEFYYTEDIGIVKIDERLIYADYLDEKLKKLGLEFEEILFASRHSSKDGRNILTVHVSGNVGTADYGGKPYSLAKPSPITMKNYTLALIERIEELPDFEFTLEATHHGPSEIQTPSAFYEIGSTEEAWRNEKAGEIVAESMIEALRDDRRDWIIAVGVGGTHYVPRQTEIMISTKFTFGHNFAKYTFPHLNEEIVEKAVKISDAKFIVIDEKSVTSNVKNLIKNVAEKLNIDVLKSKFVKREFKLKG
jgi:D-aminoacyl-tRNA deacylase